MGTGSSSTYPETGRNCDEHPNILNSVSTAYSIVRSMGYPQDVVDRASKEIVDRGNTCTTCSSIVYVIAKVKKKTH